MSAADAAIEIPNLLYRYADAIDSGRFDDAAALFDHGAVVMGSERITGRTAIADAWRRWVRLYPDGTPRTSHLITNPIIELDDAGERARCRSKWTVLQATDELPFQAVATGRYDDRFARIDGHWCFTERIYAGIDLHGDMSAHTILAWNKKQGH